MKTVWGSQPGKERGDWSRSERAYLRAATAALVAGRADARNPSLTERNCPPSMSSELKAYWRSAFKDERRNLAQVGRNAKRQDAKTGLARKGEHAVPQGCAPKDTPCQD